MDWRTPSCTFQVLSFSFSHIRPQTSTWKRATHTHTVHKYHFVTTTSQISNSPPTDLAHMKTRTDLKVIHLQTGEHSVTHSMWFETSLRIKKDHGQKKHVVLEKLSQYSKILSFTLSLWVPGPGLSKSLKSTKKSFSLQLLLLHICVVIVILQRPRGCTATLWAALLGVREMS